MELVFCVKEDARAVLVLYKYCSYFCGFVEICFNLVCMWSACVYCPTPVKQSNMRTENLLIWLMTFRAKAKVLS